MKNFYRAIKFAWTGMIQFFSRERNGQIQAVFALLAIVLGFLFSISSYQWLMVIFCIGLVISLEMMNTAIEKFCDMVTTEFHPMIKIIKDMAAGAVLFASVFSMLVGLIIFIPAILQFIKSYF